MIFTKSMLCLNFFTTVSNVVAEGCSAFQLYTLKCLSAFLEAMMVKVFAFKAGVYMMLLKF